MVVVHDVLVPMRFLALVGHFLASVLALFAVRDNVIVSLPFNYNPDELIWRMWAARAAMYVLMACLAVNAVSFFGGFSTFDVGLSVFHLTFHSIAGLLLALTVINKGHYLYLWYITLVFSGPQLLADLWTLLSLLLIGRKRRY